MDNTNPWFTIKEIGEFTLPEVSVFDPRDLESLILHSGKDYPPVVYSNTFRGLAPKTMDTPEQKVILRGINLSSNSKDESIFPAKLFDENINCSLISPAHIVPLARCIIDNEHRKWHDACQTKKTPYRIPWKEGQSHTLFHAFMADKEFNLVLVLVDFDWYDETFGLGITCLDIDDGYGELKLATYKKPS